MRVLFAGGGTGGHFFPLIAVARELKRVAESEQILDLELFYMGPNDFGVEILDQEEIRPIIVNTGKFRRYFSLLNIFDLFRVIIGVIRGIWLTYLIYPDVIFSKGGYGALPAVMGALVLRIPLIIHESDAIPGRVSRFSARFARRIGVAFPSAVSYFPKEKTAVVGVPIRKRILGGLKKNAKEALEIFSDRPVIGFLGSSQGAEKINQVILGALKELAGDYEIIHQTGTEHVEAVKGEASVILEFSHKERYHPYGFFDEQDYRDFFQASDLIVSRASSAIFEIAAWGKPAILIPLPHAAQNHQRKNAYEYAGRGAAVIIEESNLTPQVLIAEIRKVLTRPELAQKMRLAAQGFARIDSAELVAREVLKLGLHLEK